MSDKNTNKLITIALDAMGGDFGPPVTVSAALHIVKRHQDLKLILVGDKDKLEQTMQELGGALHDRLSIVHASQVVTMDELPSQALRGKKDSSMPSIWSKKVWQMPVSARGIPAP